MELTYTQRLQHLSLEERLARFTEAQLATVEHLAYLKRPRKGELERHRSIADAMVAACRDFKIEPRLDGVHGCPRLLARLAALNEA